MSFSTRKLADICSMQTGKLNSNAAVQNGIFPFFTCAQETYRINKAAFNTEAVLLGGNNANGVFPLKYYKGEFNAYQRTYVMETLDRSVLDTRYLFYALQPALSGFQAASIGAATQYLTKSILDYFKIGVPDLNAQKKIVDLLSSYDDLIENNRRRIALLEEAARLLYRKWFVHFRFPGHELVTIKRGVPEGWERTTIGARFVTVLGGTPSRKNPEFWNGDVSWINSGEVNKVRILVASEFITEEGLAKSAAKLMPSGTTVLAITGATLGQVSRIEIEASANQSVVGIF